MFFSIVINFIFFFCKSFKCCKFINSNPSCINVSYSPLPPFNFYLYTITILHSRLRNLYMHRKFFTPYPLQKSTVYQSNSVSDILSDQFTHLKNPNWIYPLFRHFMQLYRAVFMI
nr:MAG TPA: hypothetical protein [Caudoviricetes sp.]